MNARPLNTAPARTDLTDRECSRIIGGVLGALAGQCESIESLRNAVRWWAETDAAWDAMRRAEEQNRAAGFSPRR
jgi:hypothetical protein